MDDKIIKGILSKDLKHISEADFNEKIIRQLNLSKKKENQILFNQKSMIRSFVIISLLILIVNLSTIEKLPLQAIIIGIFICISPLYFMIFNKIYQSTIQKF